MDRLIKSFALAMVLLLAARYAQARIPEGKPMFVYFGFATCPYCEYLNRNTLAFDTLRKRYTDHYVLAYFDIRGNRADIITLPDGEQLTRAEAIKRLKGSPVPAWMFVSPDGKEILMRRGLRTKVDAFMKFDLYVASGAYQQGSFEDFLARRGLREDPVE